MKILTPWVMQILSAYFLVLPLRDEGAILLGLGALPGLFVGSLVLTALAAPVASLAFSLPSVPKSKALVLIHRFFSISLLVFFMLWFASKPGSPATAQSSEDSLNKPAGWGNHSWFYIVIVHLNCSLHLKVALLNLTTISSTWARVIDVMDSESGSRLFGFIGAGATLGQLFGSLFAASMTWMGPLAGITVAICASPFIATSNLVALAVWPTWVAVAVTETIRKAHGTSLAHLSPEGCSKIIDASLFAISESCSELAELDLSNCMVSDYDVTVLASAERLKLRLLSLSDCLKVTPKSVPFLGSMPASLEGLNLIGVIC
ncbi:ADP,ATP carrier protein [Hordeum vulgare]|nr:ADP,ATP carrier protein [Hordeum vulgare]